MNMDNNKRAIVQKRIDKTINALIKNNMQAIYAKTKQDALELVKGMISKTASVSMGGSMTAKEVGITDMLKSDGYNFIDRSKAKTPDEINDVYRKTFSADYFVTSSNAITENGELYNVDGNANRVAAMLYGPSNVIVIAGCNKIVKNIQEAVLRVKSTAAPANCIRLNINSYCANAGECVSLATGSQNMCDGCKSDDRICCNYVVMAQQRQKNRITVIIVGEQLGY